MKLLLTLALAASGFAETHRFEPMEFYNTFSGAHAPVLRIKPGDHVVTSTIDARGFDSAGVQRGQAPNPETAPFTSKAPSRATRSWFICCVWRPIAPPAFPHLLLAPYTADPGFLRLEALREPKTGDVADR